MKAKTRHRLFRCATALSLALLLAALALWKRSYHADEALELKRQATAGRIWRGIAIDFGSTDGTAGIAYHQGQLPLFPNNDPPSVNWWFGVNQKPFDALHSPHWSWWSNSGTWRWWGNFFIHYVRWGKSGNYVEDLAFGVPHWLLVISMACLSLQLIRRGRLIRFGTGKCQNCGYNLTANISGVCPECGSKIPETSGLQRSE